MTRHHIAIIITIFFALLFVPAAAENNEINRVPQKRLTGIVVLSDKQPVPYASVAIRSAERHTLTDEGGRFEFTNLSFGDYDLEISSIEIETDTFRVNYKSNIQSVILPVEPSTRSLNTVVVTGKNRKHDLETRGFAVSVVEPEKIAFQSIQTNELLDRTAGVRIRREGGLGSRVNYNINGLSGNAVKVFIDGVPASNYGSAFSLNSIPPSLIERVEVYKGVVPGNLSEDALGGAINIILKQRTRNSLVASYSTGSFNTHQANVGGSFRNRKGFTVDGSAFYNHSDNSYKVWGESIAFKDHTGSVTPNQTARRFHDAYSSFGTKLTAGFTNVPWANRLLVGAILSESYKEMQHGITMDAVYGDRHSRRKSAVFTMNYDKTDVLFKGLSLKIDATLSNLMRQVIDTVGMMYDWQGSPIRYPDGAPVMYTSGAEASTAKTTAKNDERTYALRTNIGYAIAKGNTVYVNYLLNGFTRSSFDRFLIPELQRLSNTRELNKNIVAVTYENIAFDSRLRTTLFYKHYLQRLISKEPYRNDKAPGEASYAVKVFRSYADFSGYGLSISFALRKNLHLMASAEKAIRLPNANEVFGNVTENLLPPTDGLKPEISYNANMGVNAGPYVVGKHTFKVTLMLFLRDTRGMIREAIRSGSFDYSQFENLENVLSRGVDSEFTYNYGDKLNFSFNISKADVLFNTEFDQWGARYAYYRMQIRNEPSFKFNANTTYFFNNVLLKKSKLGLHANISYVEAFRRNWANIGGTNLAIIPKQYPVDAGCTYALPGRKIVLGLDAKNIFNQQVFDNFGLQKPGRAFFGKITYFIW